MGQIIKSLASVCLSVSLSVCHHSCGRNFYSMLMKFCTNIRGQKVRMLSLGIKIRWLLPLFAPIFHPLMRFQWEGLNNIVTRSVDRLWLKDHTCDTTRQYISADVGKVSKETMYCESSLHLTDDVTWPQKVKVMIPNIFEAQYLKNSTGQTNWPHIGNLSCTVSEIRRLIGWKLRIFPTALSFNVLARGEPIFRISG